MKAGYGNMTGIVFISDELTSKRVELPARAPTAGALH
jgi:hypothetical protein